MKWLNSIVDEIETKHPKGDILIESGISPSGAYHMGYLREILICDAIVLELKKRGRKAKHLHFVDDQDGLRKVPADLPPEYKKYLGQALSDIPAPDGTQSYADYRLKPFLDSVKSLGVQMDVMRSHEKYRSGFFATAIEVVLENVSAVKNILQTISGRQLEDSWSPIQINEGGYLKKRTFVSIDANAKTIKYLDKDGKEQTTKYDKGQVKLDWRLDWPARWWLLKVNVEPFGRDHATKGGSYDSGSALMDKVFKAPSPIPVPYNNINRAGESKKMSASAGTGISMSEVVRVMPPEVVRYFVLRSSPQKLLFFDPADSVVKLIDEFAQLLAKADKSEADKQLISVCINDVPSVISRVPFSHLVASYQAALKDADKTIDVISRTEHKEIVEQDKEIIKKELIFIDRWLVKWATDEVKFELLTKIDPAKFSGQERQFLADLAQKVSQAPANADGEWFHKAIYELKEGLKLSPEQIFKPLYRSLIGKEQGPRAGWFLSILPREWLIKRLKLLD